MKKIFLILALIPIIIFSQIETSFEGISFSDATPPDPVIAVGENHVVLAVNNKFAIYDKNGNFISEQSFASFFGSVSPQPSGSIFDPKIVYDHYSDRYILLALNRADGNRFLLATTTTNNPSGAWNTFSIENGTADGYTDYIDYPGLGYSENTIVITSHTLRNTNSTLPEILVLKKDEVYSNDINYKKYFVDFSPYPEKLKPARVIGTSNPNKVYLIDTESPSKVRIWSITNPLGGSSATRTLEATIILASYSAPSDAVQKGEDTNIETSIIATSSISDVVCKDNILYGAYTIANTSGNGSSIKYFAIDIDDNFNILTNGIIEASSTYYFYPVIHPDGDGNMILVFNKSSYNDYVGIAYTKCLANSSAHESITWLKEGEAGYKLLNEGRNRWGDYSGIAMDPENSNRIWIYGEWAKSTNQWSTWVGEINTSETKDFYFTNKYLTTNLGGTLTANNKLLISGESTPLETGVNYEATTNNERFSNWNSTGINYKQNNWNDDTEEYYLEYGFEANGGELNHKAAFEKILYSKVAISAEGISEPGDGDISFNDPWYVKNDGTQHQPSNPSDLYWNTGTNGYYEPNGKYGASEKGVFLGQGYNPVNHVWTTPHYSVKATSPQTIYVQGKNRNFYFQNWSAYPVGSATFQHVGYLETPVVFNSSGAIVKAVMKGSGLSSNSQTLTDNNQRKVVRTTNGNLHRVYESLGKVWYERSTDNGSTWSIMNGGQPLSSYNAKLPSIDYGDDDNNIIAIVYQEERGFYSNIQLKKFSNGSSFASSNLIDSEEWYSVNYSADAFPVVALGKTAGDQLMVVWRKPNTNLQYWIGKGSGSVSVVDNGTVQNTDANSTKPSIVINRSTGYSYDYHLVWQQNTSSGSDIEYVALSLAWDESGTSFTNHSIPSANSGEDENFNPSIAITDDAPRVVWLTDAGRRIEGNLITKGSTTSWGTITKFSNGTRIDIESIVVNSLNVNDGYVAAYAGEGKRVRYYKDDGTNTYVQPLVYDKFVQLSNGANYTDMMIETISASSTPYYFTSSLVDATLSKTTSGSDAIKGREIILTKDKSNLIFEVNNIIVDNDVVDFITVEDTLITKSNEETVLVQRELDF